MSPSIHSYIAAQLTRARRFAVIAMSLVLPLLPTPLLVAQTATDDAIQFNRDIRPILSENCLHCHGPDEQTREADLRLDQRDSALADRGGYAAIVPGSAEQSEVFKRIHSDDPSTRMPPPDSERALTIQQIETLTKWMEGGAPYEPHWAFVAPHRPALPTVTHRDWPYNPIDYFILARLEQAGLRPSPQADRSTLIRRVTLDLTGLPPSPEEVARFLADDSPDSYERLVDRLLDSPRYGEQMALDWLDVARYADTHGYLFDTARSMWRWRDWVIDAYNENMRFDQFTIEQLAGDLLPDAALSQKIATGFNRNHIINNEAGAIPEEYLVENVFDRAETTASVWLGLTMQCARCHDHKYEPITQREYYEFYAFFNSVPEVGLDGFNSNANPTMKAPTELDLIEQTALAKRIQNLEEKVAALEPGIAEEQRKWEQASAKRTQPVAVDLIAHWAFDDDPYDYVHPCPATSARIVGESQAYQDGVLGRAVPMTKGAYVDAGDVANFGISEAFTLAAWIKPSLVAGRRSIVSRMDDTANFRGYTLQIVDGKLGLYLVHQFPANLLFVQANQALERNKWQHVTATYDGSGKASGVTIYVDGKRAEMTTVNDTLNGSITCNKPFWIGNGHPAAIFDGVMDDLRLYRRVLSECEVARLPGVSIDSLLAIEPQARNPEQLQRIRHDFLTSQAPPEVAAAYMSLNELRQHAKELDNRLPTVMVMQQQEQPRETRILVRGIYDRPGDVVTAATPDILPALPHDAPSNRLGLARWLVDAQQPLTARVCMNRFWQHHFGRGLVETTDDFGQQGASPTHPELLDWLSSEFVASGWNVKAMQRLLVTSATYRQSAAVTHDVAQTDPRNELYARGPRFRLTAEAIRDQALAASGLLVETIGGPSVKPYQPDNVWKEVAFDPTGAALTAQVYEQDHGRRLYRRSMYTFWKRTAPHPAMLIFDAPNRERCTVRRDRTNTPLQALVVMNSPVYIEASRNVAERLMREKPDVDPRVRIDYAFQLLMARSPMPDESAALFEFLQQQRSVFNRESAESLLKVGESPVDEQFDPIELAAYATMVNVLLNLDEVLTRN